MYYAHLDMAFSQDPQKTRNHPYYFLPVDALPYFQHGQDLECEILPFSFG